jgi:hypothetical protein
MRRAALGAWLACVGCQDLSGFTTGGDSYEGAVVQGGFVRSGVTETSRACVTLDADHFQDAPGTLSTNDGLFHTVSFRPIPQIWHDPLSTLAFGEGRLKNLVYVAAASMPFADGKSDDVFVVVSLMHSGQVEVRLLRGAPGLPQDGAATSPAANLFAIYTLSRQKGPCSY